MGPFHEFTKEKTSPRDTPGHARHLKTGTSWWKSFNQVKLSYKVEDVRFAMFLVKKSSSIYVHMQKRFQGWQYVTVFT